MSKKTIVNQAKNDCKQVCGKTIHVVGPLTCENEIPCAIHTKNKCRCGKKATTQTVKGREAEARGDLPQNYGYYCDKCYSEGLEIENQAMYE